MGWDMFSSDYLREVVNHGEEMNGDADGEDGN